MSWRDLRRLPARVRLARELLREYEAEPEPISFEDAKAALVNFAQAAYDGTWTRPENAVGVRLWRDATLAKASFYAAGSDLLRRESAPGD